MAELMGYEGLWPLGGVLKIDLKNRQGIMNVEN